MNDYNQAIIVLAIYRSITIACALAIVYWGYSLLRANVRDPATGQTATAGNPRPTLRQIAPGACFALCGFVILGIATSRGIEIELVRQRATQGYDDASNPATVGASTNTASPKPQDLSEPAAAMSSGDLPDEIKDVLKKIVSGQVLADSERKTLGAWLARNQQVPSPHLDGTSKRKDQIRKNKKATRIPVPHPGEV
jgi:hypothetical protein